MKLQQQAERFKNAEDALKNADTAAIKSLYDKAEKDLSALVGGMQVMANTGKLSPMPSNDAINAMRDVALASIELAKMIAIETYNKSPVVPSKPELLGFYRKVDEIR